MVVGRYVESHCGWAASIPELLCLEFQTLLEGGGNVSSVLP